MEGFGKGFMNFIDGIGDKLKKGKEEYRPEEYVFSDGEGVEEGEFMEGDEGEESEQEGFSDVMDSEGGDDEV